MPVLSEEENDKLAARAKKCDEMMQTFHPHKRKSIEEIFNISCPLVFMLTRKVVSSSDRTEYFISVLEKELFKEDAKILTQRDVEKDQ